MSKIEKTVFISYRRTDVFTALAVDQHLKSQGYDVFFDYTSIPGGDFEQVILSNIKARAHFIIILTPTALDRCAEPGDWLRREIETALDEKRNIIPLFFKGFSFGSSSVVEKLTGKLKNLKRYNGMNVYEDYFQASMDRLQKQFLSVPLDAILHPVSPEVQKVVREEQAAADRDAGLLAPEFLPQLELREEVPPTALSQHTSSEQAASNVVQQELKAMRDDTSNVGISLPSGALALFPTVELAFRKQPRISPDNVIRRIGVTEQLVSLEPPDIALRKVGREGEWLQVKDATGKEGYVASWLVGFPKDSADQRIFTSAPATPKLPPGTLLVLPVAQLSFRSQPVLSPETIMRYIPISEQLVCIEPVQEVIIKVGVQNKWLRVRDSSGKEGYVAAWLVKYASGSTAQQSTTSRTVMSINDGPLKVIATAEGVALRKQPVISDATLIKRLPLGTELTVLEPNAEAKIGKNDQWLKVKDPTGTEGVVAAWFVAR
jgi:SH3-like domain-containing protein